MGGTRSMSVSSLLLQPVGVIPKRTFSESNGSVLLELENKETKVDFFSITAALLGNIRVKLTKRQSVTTERSKQPYLIFFNILSCLKLEFCLQNDDLLTNHKVTKIDGGDYEMVVSEKSHD